MEKRETNASKRIRKRKRNRKIIIQSISMILILGMVFLFDVSSPKANTDEELVYKVYLDNEYLGRITDPDLIDTYLLETTESYFEEYQIEEIFTPEDFQVIPEMISDNQVVDNEEVLREFKKRAVFTVDAYKVTVRRTILVEPDGVEQDYEDENDNADLIEKLVIHEFNVLRKDDFTKGLEDYIKLFVSDAEYDRIMNNEPLPEITEDEMMLFNFYLDGEITIQKKRMNIDGLLKNREEVINYLLFKTPIIESVDEYVVKQGDTVSSVSISEEMMEDELILLNDSITSTNTILAEGMVLNVTKTDPVLTVIREHYYVTREVIPHYTKVEYDPSRWSYKQPWTKVAGDNGERLVKYKFTSVNGVTQGSAIESSEITKEPITRVLVKGSKTSSSIGTGYYRWPTISRYVSAGWGYYYPFGVRKFHQALDIAGALNDPIYAIDNGTVAYVKYHSAGGYMIKIDHNNGMESVYAHLNGWPLVSKGAVVNKGALIGRMGKSGLVTGVHLHIEMWLNGTRVNPYPYLNGWR